MSNSNQTDLNLQDLQVAINFIDVALSRGAVQGDEMLTVAVLREKLKRVVAAAQPQDEKSPELATDLEQGDVQEDAGSTEESE